MSAPAQKDAPSPVSTIARAVESFATLLSAACNSAIVAASSALCFCARVSVTRATPRESMATVTEGMRALSLHSEDAVPLFARRRAVGGGEQSRAERFARVERIDDAIIPESGGRVVGVTLHVVARTDVVD